MEKCQESMRKPQGETSLQVLLWVSSHYAQIVGLNDGPSSNGLERQENILDEDDGSTYHPKQWSIPDAQ